MSIGVSLRTRKSAARNNCLAARQESNQQSAKAYRGKEIGKKLLECLQQDYPDQVVYVMSDVDGYYEKVGYKRIGSIFEVPCQKLISHD